VTHGRCCPYDLSEENILAIEGIFRKRAFGKCTRNSCIFAGMHRTPEVSWEGTQLEVARGENFCKAACRLKNADAFTKESAGADLGISGETVL
jgi:hypothetical protein